MQAPQSLHHVPTAREIMTTSVVSLAPDQDVFEAMAVLVGNEISGAPVVAEDGEIVGMLTELDCLRVLASDEFHAHDRSGAVVGDYMSRNYRGVGPEADIYGLAQYFLTRPVRRFPVVEGSKLLGLVSRRDVLRGILAMRTARAPRKKYPDYREPAL